MCLGLQTGTASNGGTTQVQAWVQGAIAKINSSSNVTDTPSSTTLTSTTPVANLPLSVSTATFPGTPAVRLIGDCHFLHRICQLLLFCLIFRKRQLPRFVGGTGPRPTPEGVASKPKEEPLVGPRTTGSAVVKTEEGVPVVARTTSTVSKGADDVANPRLTRVGNGNCGQGYTSEEVRVYLQPTYIELGY